MGRAGAVSGTPYRSRGRMVHARADLRRHRAARRRRVDHDPELSARAPVIRGIGIGPDRDAIRAQDLIGHDRVRRAGMGRRRAGHKEKPARQQELSPHRGCRVSSREGDGAHVHRLRGNPDRRGRDRGSGEGPGDRRRHWPLEVIPFRNQIRQRKRSECPKHDDARLRRETPRPVSSPSTATAAPRVPPSPEARLRRTARPE